MPKIHTAPQTQSLFKLEKVRNELSERVELATDQNGQVDLNTVSGPTREILEAIGGGSTFSAADFKTKLESALDTLDRADVDNARGPKHILSSYSQRSTAVQRDTLNRRRGNDFDEIEASPIMGRIRSLLRGSRDLRLEPSERAKVGEAGANAVLDAADVRTESRNESLAKKHFTGEQFFSIESKTAHVKTGSLAGGPGALTGISAVMVKNVDEGKWTSVNVKADGSYDLQLDQAVGTLSVWFEKEDGEKFFGGQVRDSSRDVKQNVWSAVIDNNFSPSPLSYAFRNDD